ncbi:MAG: ABC transporter ATP-binding protein [Pseudomonas sp. CO183]|nr:MAG: ABC transporter ATP-binding protein [Pseudomonas sp. CO183]
MNALEVSDVGFAYGARRALDGVSFTAAQGRFTALLGPNGAGKSTLIALLTRLYDLQQGQIHIAGFGLRETPRKALARLGVVFQQSTLDLDLTVEQNLRYHAALHGMPRAVATERIEVELQRQQLGERHRSKVRELNGGHRRRVEIARALLHRPDLLLLDEASAGLDPASRQALNQHVRMLCQEQGMSVLWTTHLLDEVHADDDLLVLNRGRLVAQGSVASVALDGEDLAASFARLTGDATQSAPAPTLQRENPAAAVPGLPASAVAPATATPAAAHHPSAPLNPGRETL